jgi:hypothetical protein
LLQRTRPLARGRPIDEVEVGRQVAPKIRIAFEVADGATATAELVAAGAELIAAPRETPWRSLNSRLAAPAGLHITLFEELTAESPRPPRLAPLTGGVARSGVIAGADQASPTTRQWSGSSASSARQLV